MTPSTALVIRYWCAIGTIGTVTPASAATSGVYMPHASTTDSASIVPWSVTTCVMRPVVHDEVGDPRSDLDA